MGEIADMMLDGTLCETCGEYLGPVPGDPNFDDWEPPGFPDYCDTHTKKKKRKQKIKQKNK